MADVELLVIVYEEVKVADVVLVNVEVNDALLEEEVLV